MDLANKLFINGKFVDPILGKTFVNYKPTSGGREINICVPLSVI
jgi:hypothetical protein